jgi:hypothetical protein
MRCSPTRRRRSSIPAPPVIQEYSDNMGGVDMKDRDSSDYSTSIRTNPYYLRIFFWILDGAIHAMYRIVVAYDKRPQAEDWKAYKSKNGGRKRFQIDMAVALLDYAIRLEWPSPYEDSTRPKWMRQKSKLCFFCKVGLMNGIDHETQYKPLPAKQVPTACSGERVNIRSNPQECAECSRVVKEQKPNLKWIEQRKRCSKIEYE